MSQHASDNQTSASGVLLINLGTPDSPKVGDVRRYLREFLSDPYVIDIPTPLRLALVYGLILPFRPRKSAKAYQQVWTDRGSPLRFHAEDLHQRLQDTSLWQQPPGSVALAMRYGKPSIQAAFDQLQAAGIQHVKVFPMFPQYSESAWLTAAKACEKAAQLRGMTTSNVQPFYDHPSYLDVLASYTATHLDRCQPDKVLMSFHGLPERHMRKIDTSPTGHCLQRDNCCDAMVDANRNCYRAHCFATARGLASRLGLSSDQWEVSFQSRLGRTPWIQPFTDHRIPKIAAAGCRRLAVVCPSFVADCLETIEEIGITADKSFQEHGGEKLHLIPALNSHPAWVKVVAELIEAAD